MAGAGADAKPDTAPDASTLTQEVERLKTERDGAIGRAQKRYTEKLHAQADVRRAHKEIRVLQHRMQDKDAVSTKLFLSYQVTISELKEQLANADGSGVMDQVQQQMQQQHAAQVQQMQAEHNQKIDDARNGAQKLLAETRVEDSHKVRVAQQAEQKAKHEAHALRDEVKKLRDQNMKKDDEISYLKKKIQNKSEQLGEVRREPEPRRWTPQKQASPKVVRTPTYRHGNPSTLSPIGKSSILSHATRALFEATNGNGSLTPHEDLTKQAFAPQMYSPHPPNQLTPIVEGESMDPFVGQAINNQNQGQHGSQSGMQSGPQGTIPQSSSPMSPPLLPQRGYPHSNQDSLRRGEQSRASSTVESSPQQKQQSTAAALSNAFSTNIRSAMQQTGSQTPVPRVPSQLPQAHQEPRLGPNGESGFYNGLSNHLQGAMPRPAPPPRALSNPSQASQSKNFQDGSMLEAMFNGQPDAMQGVNSQNGSQGPPPSPSLHQPTPINRNNTGPLNLFQVGQLSPLQQNNAAYNGSGQPQDGQVTGSSNELEAQMTDILRAQTSFENVMQNTPNLPPTTNNRPMPTRRSPRLQNRQLAGNACNGQQAALSKAAQGSHALQQQQQIPNAAPNGCEHTPNLNLQQIPVMQQPQPNAIVLTLGQKDIMQHFLQQQDIHHRVREIMQQFLLRMVPENGGRHTTLQYTHAHNMARRYYEARFAENTQQPRLQQNMNQPNMLPHSQRAFPNPQLQPYGYQTHPGQRSQQPPTNAHLQQTRTILAPTSAASNPSGQYTGVACTNCHEVWANTWCDDNEPCENCASTGAECKRPACEFVDVPKAQCSKHGRCNRAHKGEGWTVADFKKDLKRKGKQNDEREWTVKRRRLEGI